MTTKDLRQQFEDWYWDEYHIYYNYSQAYRPKLFSRQEGGDYRLMMVHDAFTAYQAGYEAQQAESDKD